MSETKESKTENKTRRRRTPAGVNFSAEEKAQAVLAVWTEKARSSEVCRQMSVNWITFNHWQQRAMEGMLQALESRVNLAKGEALSPRLQSLLNKRQRAMTTTQMSARLEKIQQGRSREETAKGS
jgi:transposase-like protein